MRPFKPLPERTGFHQSVHFHGLSHSPTPLLVRNVNPSKRVGKREEKRKEEVLEIFEDSSEGAGRHCIGSNTNAASTRRCLSLHCRAHARSASSALGSTRENSCATGCQRKA